MMVPQKVVFAKMRVLEINELRNDLAAILRFLRKRHKRQKSPEKRAPVWLMAADGARRIIMPAGNWGRFPGDFHEFSKSAPTGPCCLGGAVSLEDDAYQAHEYPLAVADNSKGSRASSPVRDCGCSDRKG